MTPPDGAFDSGACVRLPGRTRELAAVAIEFGAVGIDDRRGLGGRGHHFVQESKALGRPPLVIDPQVISGPMTPPKSTPTPPLMKSERAVLSFAATKDGKITVNYGNWDATKVVLEGPGV